MKRPFISTLVSAYYFVYIISLLLKLTRLGIISLLQMTKLNLREIKESAQGHLPSKFWKEEDQVPDWSLLLSCSWVPHDCYLRSMCTYSGKVTSCPALPRTEECPRMSDFPRSPWESVGKTSTIRLPRPGVSNQSIPLASKDKNYSAN